MEILESKEVGMEVKKRKGGQGSEKVRKTREREEVGEVRVPTTKGQRQVEGDELSGRQREVTLVVAFRRRASERNSSTRVVPRSRQQRARE